ncbi:unnamed protein product [Symbiodinium necroappetens]|uniref:Uncharacterized protein n=1 Tax=Symbiodinium necroappetens TaxID=1628268 RepID=A0A812UVC3_9DINO|nr:unnamed protein product [Symbiodinium necroappetens]
MSADQGAMQQFQDMRGRFSRPDYTAVQQEFWEQQRRNKRSAPTPLQSGLTTPQGGGQSSQTAPPQGASEDGPSLLQPFSFEDSTAVGLTAATHGVDINDQTAIKNCLAKPVQNNQQVFEMVRSYHRAVIPPEMYNLVLQLEAALKPVDKSVFKARQELQWLSADNRLAQKHQAGLQVLTSGWPNFMKPDQRIFMVGWMLAQCPRIVDFLKFRGFITDQTAHEMPRYINALTQDPTTMPQQNDLLSTMTLLSFKSWDTRQAFMEKFGGSAGTPLYSDESTPLELPLRIILSMIDNHPDYTAGGNKMTILCKTLTVMAPKDDDEFDPDAKVWARLFCFQDRGDFVGRLEVVPELARLMVWGAQYELDQADQTAARTALQESAMSGKGVAKGKGKKHWSNTVIWNSYYCPYPFNLTLTKVDEVAFVWDEYCDKKGKTAEKVGDYAISTYRGKPAAPEHTADPGPDPFLHSDDVEMQEDRGTAWGRGSGHKGGRSGKPAAKSN